MTPKIFDNYPEVTRKKRKNLLVMCFIGFAIGYAKIIPTKIALLGFEFKEINKGPFLTLMIILISYFFVDFYRSVWIDNQRAKGKITSERKTTVMKSVSRREEEETLTKTKYTEPWQYAFPAIMIHSLVEVVIPFPAAVLSIFFVSLNY